jgi:hypothetical protein
MDTMRSLYIEMLEELEVFGWDDDYSSGLQRRAAAALEHVDATRQPWPVLTPDQPPAAIWKQLAGNRQAIVDHLVEIGILDRFGSLTPAYTELS